MALVSIIVPARDCAGLTAACLASVARHTPLPHELLLVDDASGAEAAAVFARLAGGGVRLLRNERRGTFSANNNRAAREARGDYLCLLNNDTLVAPGWLEALLAVLEREPDIGVLGNKHLFPDRPGLHHAGIAFDERGFPLHLHPHADPGLPAVNYQRDVPCVTFACVLIPAAVYRRLGGLDEAYRNGFEDCDFCLRARHAGLRVTYTPASVIRHHGQRSPERTRYDDENWALFQRRWPERERGSLERITREDRDHNAAAAGRPRRRPAPPPGLHLALDLSAGNAFTWAGVAILEALLARGDRVGLSVPHCPRISPTIPAPQRRRLRSLMLPQPCGTWHVKWSHYWRTHLRRELFGEVNAELFCTNYRGGIGRRATDPWLRSVQVNGHRKLPVARFNLEALGDIGVPAADCAVVPLGYSPEIERLLPGRREPPRRDARHLLLVTNSHDLRRYGTDVALRALGEAFGPRDPVVLHIRDYGASRGDGRLRAWIAAQPRLPRVVWHDGFLPKEDLLRLYAGMDALLAPFRGEGFSMKILDALALGLPVFMPAFGGPTEYAAPGTFVALPWKPAPVGACLDRDSWYLSDEAWWCEPDAEALAAALRGWLADDAAALAAGEAAAARVRGRYTWANTAERLLEALGAWRARQLAAVSLRREPDRLPLSVVIPTRERSVPLAKTLAAYAGQSLPARDYELILVNDHGERPPLEAAVAPFRGRLPLQLFDNPGPGGPAAARNAGIERARGGVVLFTGDDIVPERDFLRAHLDGHRRFPALEEGVVGLNRWHPDLPLTPFMEHIAGAGGQQFNYRGLADGGPAPFDRFYTSNCSIKRAFLLEEPGLFSTAYRFAAYEDVELAYRLHLRGLRLRYLAGAVGLHDHPMTPASFLERQVRAGRMLALLAIQRPGYVPDEHAAFLAAMEFALRTCADGERERLARSRPGVLELLLEEHGALLRLAEGASAPAADAGGRLRGDAGLWGPFLGAGADRVWDAAGEIALRVGMAAEWGVSDEDRAFLAAWVEGVSLARLLGRNDLFAALPHGGAAGSPAAALLADRVHRLLRSTPVVRGLFSRFEQSGAGAWTRELLLRSLRRR